MTNRILIVEDDPMSLRLLRDLLRVSGYSTIEATDGERGVESAKANRPDLILMDVMMPKMDGYSACVTLKADKSTGSIPVVMVTSLDQPLNKTLGKNMGADGYITKPIDREELLEVVGRFLPMS